MLPPRFRDCLLLFVLALAGVCGPSIGQLSGQANSNTRDKLARSLESTLALDSEIIPAARFVGLTDATYGYQLEFERTKGLDDRSSKNIRIGLDRFGWWGAATAELNQPLTRLANGSLLAGFLNGLTKDSASISSLEWQDIQLRRDQVAAILFYLPVDKSQQQLWLQRLDDQLPQVDRVWVRTGDFLEGKIVAIEDSFVEMETNGQQSRIRRDRVALVTFAASEDYEEKDKVGRASPRLELCFSDGTRLRVSQVSFSERQLQATLESTDSKKLNLELELRDDLLAQEHAATGLLCGIRALKNENDYLSNRVPDRYQHQPLLGNKTEYRNNSSLSGGPLYWVQAGQDWVLPFGVAVPSRSSLIYQLGGGEKSLQFGVTCQPSSGQITGDVTCKVLGLDQQKKWQVLWEQQVDESKTAFAQLPMDGMTAVALAVDYGKAGDVGDRVQWLMPRLTR